jgi:hypothetical protein
MGEHYASMLSLEYLRIKIEEVKEVLGSRNSKKHVAKRDLSADLGLVWIEIMMRTWSLQSLERSLYSRNST